MKPYVIQCIIRLFCERVETPAERLLKNVVLEDVIERKDKFVVQGIAFDSLLTYTSEGLISGLIKQEENGLEPPSELLDLFEGPLRMMIESFLLDRLNLYWHFVLGVYFPENWQNFLAKEVAMSWKQMRTHSLFMHPGNGFFKVCYAHGGSLEDRMNSYLNAYEKFLKPIVHEFKFGQSYANLMTTFYFFQYLQYLTWIHPLAFSEATLSRLITNHTAFMQGSLEFAQRVTHDHRRIVGEIPFLGWWCHDGRAFDGMLMPMALFQERYFSKFKFAIPLLKIVFCHVDFEPIGEQKALGIVRPHALSDNSVQLLVYTTKKQLDAVWFRKFVYLLNSGVYEQNELMLLIQPFK